MPSTNATARGANLALEIERQGGNTAPCPSRVHVIRTDGDANLDDAANHFVWSPAPPTFSAADAQSESVARREGFLLIRPDGWAGEANKLTLAAWNGPHWGPIRRKDVTYELVAEFGDGLLLKSEPQRMTIAS